MVKIFLMALAMVVSSSAVSAQDVAVPVQVNAFAEKALAYYHLEFLRFQCFDNPKNKKLNCSYIKKVENTKRIADEIQGIVAPFARNVLSVSDSSEIKNILSQPFYQDYNDGIYIKKFTGYQMALEIDVNEEDFFSNAEDWAQYNLARDFIKTEAGQKFVQLGENVDIRKLVNQKYKK